MYIAEIELKVAERIGDSRDVDRDLGDRDIGDRRDRDLLIHLLILKLTMVFYFLYFVK